jgi:hypothetical protein
VSRTARLFGLLGLLGLVFAVATSCATKIYQGPTSGRGAESQQAVAMSAKRAFADFDVSALGGKRVVVEAYGLTERLEGESPEEAFCRLLLTEKLLENGVQVVGSRKDADVVLSATLEVVGVDIIRRDVPLLYHHTTFRGLTRARLAAYKISGDSILGTITKAEVAAESTYRESYVFYIFGPITSRSTEAVGPPATQ